MPKVDVVDLENNKVGEVDLADSVFGAEINDNLLYEAVKHYLACHRSGSAKTKTRAEVSGSGRKPWRQKGTGRARVGSIRSPIWRSGGVTHGPQPRDYSYRLPKKMYLGALRSALSAKLRDGELKVVREFALDDHKTKAVRAALDSLEAARTVLLIDNPEDSKLELGSRNLAGVTMMRSPEVTPYHLLGHKQVFLSEAAAKKLSEALEK
ncbi:MAG: 50S ribosomal protein L4 [bacterium]|nr:50S ribosomal protein L4 [bacterium]